MIRVILLFSLITCMSVWGGEKTLTVPERLFNMTGADVNISQGDLLYKSQAAGYYSGGGGMIVRSPVQSIRFANAAMPQIQAGCGGIDIYTGGFSFISGQQIVDTMQKVASNAGGYAFMLGIETVSPQMANTIRQMQSWANTINAIGINSCETAAQLTGAVWPANEMASDHICRSIGTSNNTFKDYVEGRHRCGTKTEKERLKSEIKKVMPLSGEYNIAWMALNMQPLFQNQQNKALAEMYMTIVGTLIVRKSSNGELEPIVLPSKAEDSEFLQKIIEGGAIAKYECQDRDQCLVILEKNETLNSENSWFARIRKTLMSMQEKAIHDEPLNDEEKGLLATTRLPLYKYVNVISAYRRGKPCPLDFESIADIVAWDVLSQVIAEALDTVTLGCQQIRANSAYTTQIDEYLANLERVRRVVQGYQQRTQKALDLEMRLIEKMQMLEKQINSEIMIQ